MSQENQVIDSWVNDQCKLIMDEGCLDGCLFVGLKREQDETLTVFLSEHSITEDVVEIVKAWLDRM